MDCLLIQQRETKSVHLAARFSSCFGCADTQPRPWLCNGMKTVLVSEMSVQCDEDCPSVWDVWTMWWRLSCCLRCLDGALSFEDLFYHIQKSVRLIFNYEGDARYGRLYNTKLQLQSTQSQMKNELFVLFLLTVRYFKLHNCNWDVSLSVVVTG